MRSISRILISLATVSTLWTAPGIANAGAILEASLDDFTNGGGFFADVLIKDGDVANSVMISVDIGDPNQDLNSGDILAIFFNTDADFGITAPVTSMGNTTPGNINTIFTASGLVDGGGTTIVAAPPNGNQAPLILPLLFGPEGPPDNNADISGGNPSFQFDFGVLVGDNGSSAGFNQTISFIIAGVEQSLGLNAMSFSGDVGLRVQSISIDGTNNTFASTSSKLRGVTQTPPSTPVPSPTPLVLLGAGVLAMRLSMRKAIR